MDKVLSKPRLGELRIQKKLILNKRYPDLLEVVVGEIEVVKNRFGTELHYILSFGGDKKIRIIGKKNWNAFVDMLKWIEWDPEETQEIYIPQLDNHSEKETHENTIPHIQIENPSGTLEFDYSEINEEIDDIIDGIPIDD